MLVHTENSEKETLLLDTILAIANELETTATHIAIAWLLHKADSSTTAIIPILGSRTAAQLDATMGALNVALSTNQVERLNAASAVSLGVPHEQINASFKNISGGHDLKVLIKPA